MNNRLLKFRVWDKAQGKFLPEYSPVFLASGTLSNRDDSTFAYQQFTGCLDNNGREIFEGDILFYEGVCQGVVVYDGGSYRLGCASFPDTNWTIFEVKGNVWENAALIPDEEKKQLKHYGFNY